MPAQLSMKYFEGQARRDKTFANKALKNKEKMGMACEVSKEWWAKASKTPVKQLAQESFGYWKVRKQHDYTPPHRR